MDTGEQVISGPQEEQFELTHTQMHTTCTHTMQTAFPAGVRSVQCEVLPAKVIQTQWSTPPGPSPPLAR